MVLVEEIEDDEPQATELSSAKAPPASKGPDSDVKSADSGLKKGFLSDAAILNRHLYPPEGSPEGVVAPETHKAHMEHDYNEKVNKMMNRGANPEDYPKPEWYNPDWPKGCQYNSPGCTLEEFDSSGHQTDMHKDMVRNNERWTSVFDPEVKSLRLSFLQLTDEDIAVVCEQLKKNANLKELDLSYNKIKDTGIQTLVGALANGKAAPNLEELRVYKNEFTDLSVVMLTQGLTVFRKKLKVVVEEPDYSGLGKTSKEPSELKPAPTLTSASEMD